MSSYSKLLQARCKALGFDPGPIDGVIGKNTRMAIAEATAFQAKKGKPFIHPSGISRVHFHWTGGVYIPNEDDKAPYHFLIDGEGNVLEEHPATERLSHTKNANNGALAVSICAMRKAWESPFMPGTHPVKEVQVISAAKLTAKLCTFYDIPIVPEGVLMHSEVEEVLNIKQTGKWDCDYLPPKGKMESREAGNYFRKLVREHL